MRLTWANVDEQVFLTAGEFVVEILQIGHGAQLVDIGERDGLHRLVQQVQVGVLDHRGDLRVGQVGQDMAVPEELGALPGRFLGPFTGGFAELALEGVQVEVAEAE